jgi:hypothetical protein
MRVGNFLLKKSKKKQKKTPVCLEIRDERYMQIVHTTY